MILPDVNVLIHAFRQDMPQHERCRSWLSSVVGGPSSYALSHSVLSAVVRITTSPRVFNVPSTLDEAFGFCHALTAQSNCRIVEPGDRHWSIFEQLCRETDTRGPRVTDAWLAAVAIEHGCTWVTLDRDFARFPALEWRVPG